MYSRRSSTVSYGYGPRPHSQGAIYDDRSQPYTHPQQYPVPESLHPLQQPLSSSVYPPGPLPQAPAIYGPPQPAKPIPPPSFVDDPAFSADPLTNPYAYSTTTYAMNSREEIVPVAANQPHYNSSGSRGSASRRDISSIYGPPATEKSAGSHSHSRPPSDVSVYARSSHVPTLYALDPRASNSFSDASARLAYDTDDSPEPSPHPPVIPIQSSDSKTSSRKSKLHKPRPSQPGPVSTASLSASLSNSSYSASSSYIHSSLSSSSKSRSKSSLFVANPSPDNNSNPYAIFHPRHSPGSSASSVDDDEPHTPPSVHEQLHPNASATSLASRHSQHKGYLDDKALLDRKEDADAQDLAVPDAPPAYSALPTPTETIATAGPSTRRDSKAQPQTPVARTQPQTPVTVTLTPAGLTIETPSGSTSIPQGGAPEAGLSRPTILPNASAPELHVPPTREVPVRANTTPFAAPAPAPATNTSTNPPNAPPVQKTRSRKPSIATPPKDLDKIDELDETDPLGLQWHNDGPYEAINKIVKGSLGKSSGGGAKIFAAQGAPNGAQTSGSKSSSRRKAVPVDPNVTSFGIKPGQIFPQILAPSAVYPIGGPVPIQAPMSPPQPSAYANAHMFPAARDDPVPPIFSPTPSQMERLRQTPQQRTSVIYPESNFSGIGAGFAASQSSLGRPPMGMPMPSSSSGHSSSQSSSHSSNGHRGAPPQMPPPVPQVPPEYLHNTVHRHSPPTQPPPQVRPQPSKASLSRSHSAPSTRQTPVSLPSELPPTPDIQLPPPPQSAPSIAPSQARGAPSVYTSSSARSQALPPRHMPKRLVMPTPLQQMQPLPQPAASAPANHGGYGYLNTGSAYSTKSDGLRRGASAPVRRPQAQDIPMSSGKNLLRKHKEKEHGESERKRSREMERPAPVIPSMSTGATPAMVSGRVVVDEPREGKKGGISFFSFGSKDKQKDKERERQRALEREREKEQVMERARERSERVHKESKKLSKRR